MKQKNKEIALNNSSSLIKSACYTGNFLTFTGCLGLATGALGMFDMNYFSTGLSSGVRIIGTVAISGCLVSAISYGLIDFFNTNK